MALPNIFKKEVSDQVFQRIISLKPNTTPIWGKMNVAQMLAHSSVMFELVYENKQPRLNPIVKFSLKTFVKKTVTNEKPYKKNSQTVPAFVINDERNLEAEKARLIEYINKTQKLGEANVDKKDSHSFGVLSKTEWNNIFYKHLDHHLTQFGV